MQELNFNDDRDTRSIRSESHLAWMLEMAEERKLAKLADEEACDEDAMPAPTN